MFSASGHFFSGPAALLLDVPRFSHSALLLVCRSADGGKNVFSVNSALKKKKSESRANILSTGILGRVRHQLIRRFTHPDRVTLKAQECTQTCHVIKTFRDLYEKLEPQKIL